MLSIVFILCEQNNIYSDYSMIIMFRDREIVFKQNSSFKLTSRRQETPSSRQSYLGSQPAQLTDRSRKVRNESMLTYSERVRSLSLARQQADFVHKEIKSDRNSGWRPLMPMEAYSERSFSAVQTSNLELPTTARPLSENLRSNTASAIRDKARFSYTNFAADFPKLNGETNILSLNDLHVNDDPPTLEASSLEIVPWPPPAPAQIKKDSIRKSKPVLPPVERTKSPRPLSSESRTKETPSPLLDVIKRRNSPEPIERIRSAEKKKKTRVKKKLKHKKLEENQEHDKPKAIKKKSRSKSLPSKSPSPPIKRNEDVESPNLEQRILVSPVPMSACRRESVSPTKSLLKSASSDRIGLSKNVQFGGEFIREVTKIQYSSSEDDEADDEDDQDEDIEDFFSEEVKENTEKNGLRIADDQEDTLGEDSEFNDGPLDIDETKPYVDNPYEYDDEDDEDDEDDTGNDNEENDSYSAGR
ncbi:unnamed protein product [Dimorphilus gyrociliatus]|uniref:Uncharacterized protein n=1 Tax=Dimorphilus gyrociliatus TaxID=2664684 RepID=A0A7I8W6K3_9ANNE|nr:unnamed protein product [Dimorphilus gyrociliatus]